MKYKVGDKVKIKSLEWFMSKHRDRIITTHNYHLRAGLANCICGCYMDIIAINQNGTYRAEVGLLDTDIAEWMIDGEPDMFEDANQEPCEYCSPFAFKTFEDVFHSIIKEDGEFLIDSWDCSSRFKINYCPICGRKL